LNYPGNLLCLFGLLACLHSDVLTFRCLGDFALSPVQAR
jgi:hypothetical protein